MELYTKINNNLKLSKKSKLKNSCAVNRLIGFWELVNVLLRNTNKLAINKSKN